MNLKFLHVDLTLLECFLLFSYPDKVRGAISFLFILSPVYLL